MMKPAALLLALCLGWSGFAQFGPVTGLRWAGHGDTPASSARFQLTQNGIAVEFQPSPVNGCWVRGELAKTRPTGGFLTFRGRSTDGQERSAAMHVNLLTADGKHAGFLSYIDLAPEWQEYNINLQLRTLSWTEARQGKLVFTGGDAGAIDLAEGEIESIMFSSGLPGTAEIADLALAPVPSDEVTRDAVAAVIEKRLKEHPKVVPYRFAHTGNESFELARDGHSDWQIAIPADTPAYAFAAAELARYIRLATQAEMPVVTDAAAPAITLAVVSPESAEDGFRVTGNADGIAIVANNSRSLLFAVYGFLEKSLGIRFLAPYDFAEIVPAVAAWELPEFDDAEQAAYSYRRMHYCSAGDITPHELLFTVADWNVKNRFNVQLERLYSIWEPAEEQTRKQRNIEAFYALRGGCIEYVEYWGHNYHLFVPPEQYFATHPEYFPYDRATGVRRADQAQLCTTNPEVIRIIADRVLEYFRATPDAEFFPLFQEDGTTLWCQCDGCLAIVAPHRRDVTGYDADRVIYLANAVADAIQPEFPGRKIVTYAYSTGSTPPDVIMPNEHVYIEYCVYGDGNPTIPAYRGNDRANIERWQQLTGGRMIIYSYHALGFTYQFRDPATMAQDLRYFADIGLRGTCQETAETWGMDGYLYYISARLAWNPWLDLDALESDYFAKLYGPAAGPMREFHHRLLAGLSDPARYVSILFARKPCLTNEEMTALEQLQLEAEQLAPESAAVAFHRKTLRYIQAANRMIALCRHLLEEPTEANRAQAETACDAVIALVLEQAPDWVVTRYDIGTAEHLKTMIKMIMDEAGGLAELKRGHTILQVLSTPWQFRTDGAAAGDAAKWYAADFDDSGWKPVNSGAFWEDQGFPGFDGIGWYRRTVELPEDTAGLRLYFGGADERAWVYLDGVLIGAHEAGDIGQLWQEAFYIDLPAGVAPGLHQLTVKVIDTAGGGGLWKDVFLVRKK